MKLLRIIGLVVVVGMISTIVVHGDDAASFDNPVVLDNAMLSITVSDLHGLFEGAGSVAANISPMMNGIMLKSMIGAQLEDPQLSGIERGKGLAVVMVNPSNIFAVIEISSSQLATYTNKLTTMGMKSQNSGGVLVVAQTSEQVSTGISYVDAVKSQLLNKRTPSLRVTFSPTYLVAQNQDKIDGMLNNMTAAMQMSMQQSQTNTVNSSVGTEKILEGEMQIILSLAKQIESAEINLFPKNGSINLSEIFVPIKGSDLAKLCNAPAINTWNKKLQAGNLGDGAFQVDFLLKNPKALSDFIAIEADKLIAEMKLDAAKIKPIIELTQRYLENYGGSACESIMLGGKNMMSVNYLIEVKDAETALIMFKDAQANMKAVGMLEFYSNMGIDMSMALTENVREHKGIKIHKLATTIDISKLPQEQKKAYETMDLTNMTCEIAIFDGIMACTLNGAGIEDLIDRHNNPDFIATPLHARKELAGDGSYYMDMDIGKYMDFISSMMPTGIPNMPDFNQIGESLKGADKITNAGYCKKGKLAYSLRIPGSLITRIGQMVMMMAMQSQQTQ